MERWRRLDTKRRRVRLHRLRHDSGARPSPPVPTRPFEAIGHAVLDGIFAAMDAGTLRRRYGLLGVDHRRAQSRTWTSLGAPPLMLRAVGDGDQARNAEKCKTLVDLDRPGHRVQSGTTGGGVRHQSTSRAVRSWSAALPGRRTCSPPLQSGIHRCGRAGLHRINAYCTTADKNFVITEKIPTEEQYGWRVKKATPRRLGPAEQGSADGRPGRHL